MIQPCKVDASPPGMYFCVLREGEKISGSGLGGLDGDVGCGGRMKAGRCGAELSDVGCEMLALSGLTALKSAGVRGGGTMKR
jgi:hypothetical protein